MFFQSLLLIVLVVSIFLFTYNYFIYPALVIYLSQTRVNEHDKLIKEPENLPGVSFIIAAYNEEKVIKEKILNTLQIDYPKDKLQIIIVSDGSDDSTPDIVSQFSEVTGMHNPARAGKSAALNRAVENATGEFLVFSDANNDFSENSIKQLIKHFSDPIVGAVTGAKHIYENEERESSAGDGLYWKYESRIKKAESHLGSITAAEGEILAVRKSLYKPIESYKVNDDAAITFDLVKAGYRVLYEEEARSTEQASLDLKDDFNVKIRMTFGGFQSMALEKKFLFPPSSWFAFTFVSHKVLRWFAPHFLILMLFCSLALSNISIVNLFLWCQIIFYAIACYGWRNRSAKKLASWIYVPMYFTYMNLALFYGFLRYLKDSSKVEWKKAER